MFLLWLRQLPWCRDWTPASVPPPTEGRSSPSNTPVFPPSSFILLSFASIYILFHRSGTPVRSQLVFCMHFCVWRCVPDVSVERDVLHIHLLLQNLVILKQFLNMVFNYISSVRGRREEMGRNGKNKKNKKKTWIFFVGSFIVVWMKQLKLS